ncbi:MAG: GDSL-type esterase/lipase family protein [Pirellulaceae bacterium]
MNVKVILLWLVVLVNYNAPWAAAQSEKPLWEQLETRSPWVFWGDSNTYSGGYVAILDAWLQSSTSAHRIKLLNLGMSSETAAGTSEVDHPFKRPCVHERLSKALAMTRPGVVFICYGMNDGIYQPPSAANQAAYEAGMLKLATEIRATGAKLICLTPPIFEPEPVAAKGNLGPASTGRFAYFAPAENYNQTLQQQAAWCLKNELGADAVIDIHTLLAEEKQRRLADNPDFAYSGDGVHFGDEAHGLIAEKILVELGAPRGLISAYPQSDAIAAARKRMLLLRDAYLSAVGKNRPGLPAGYPVWYAEKLAKEL